MLGVPLLREGAVIGTINMARRRVEPFTERQIELVRTFADQAVIAIENARLLKELQQRTSDLQESLEYQTATSDVLKVISRSTFDIQPVFETIVETAARLCGADSALIINREGEAYRVVATFAQTPEFDAVMRGRLLTADRGSVAGRTAIEGQVVHIHDIASDPEYTMTEAVTLGKNRTILGVPLLRDGGVVGVIGLGRTRVQPFTERQIELVRTFADQAVIALENARLLGELQARTRDLEESLEYQTATSDVLNVISRSTADVQPVLDTVIETAARLCGADAGTILIREGEVYRPVSSSFSAADPEYWARVRQRTALPGRDSVLGRVALEGRVVHIEDIRADPDFAVPEAVAAGRRTMLGVPLLREGAVLGTINLSRQRSSRLPSGRSNWSAPLPTRRSSRSRMRGCSARSASGRPSCASPSTTWATGSQCSTPSSGSRRGTAISSSFSICPTLCWPSGRALATTFATLRRMASTARSMSKPKCAV